MASKVFSNILIGDRAFTVDDSIYVEPFVVTPRPPQKKIISILKEALLFAKNAEIKSVNIYSSLNLQSELNDSATEYFSKNIFPYFVDIKFHTIPEHVIVTRIDAVQKILTSNETKEQEMFLKLQKDIASKESKKKISKLKKGK